MVRSAGQITITIEKQSVPAQHNSYLLIEGDRLKTNNSRCTDANLVAPTNNVFQVEINTSRTDG